MNGGRQKLSLHLQSSSRTGYPCHLWIILLLLVSPAAAATSSTLRLGEIFDTRPGEGPFIVGTNRYDPEGPILFIPDTSAWKVPRPTPIPTPTPKIDLPPGVDLSNIHALRPTQAVFNERKAGRPGYHYLGLIENPNLPHGEALLETSTLYHHLRVEYLLIPEKGTELEPLRFYHGPMTEESFGIPAGDYHVQRRIWMGESMEEVVTEEYESQRFRPRGSYRFEPLEEKEENLIQRYFHK